MSVQSRPGKNKVNISQNKIPAQNAQSPSYSQTAKPGKPIPSRQNPNKKTSQVKSNIKKQKYSAYSGGEMEEAVVRKVGVLSVANIVGLVNVFIGLILGIIVTILAFLRPFLIGYGLLGKLAVIIFPISYGVVGWILGAIAGVFYNLAAKLAQGIKLYSY